MSHVCNGCGKPMRWCDEHGCVKAAKASEGKRLTAHQLMKWRKRVDDLPEEELIDHIAAVEAENAQLREAIEKAWNMSSGGGVWAELRAALKEPT